MKRLVVILGANGVGKSTTSRLLNEKIKNSVYIDMEYCCRMNPFQHTEKTIPFIQDNIYALISNCMEHSCVETVLFPYGLHGPREHIYKEIMQKLNQKYQFQYYPIVLECSIDENIARMRMDKRDDARIQRGLEHSNVYHDTSFPRIDTTNKSVEEVANIVLSMLNT